MRAEELIEIISRCEDSRHQFKENVTNADEVPARGMNAADIDMDYFKKYSQKQYGESIDDQEIPLTKLLENMDLMKDGIFNLAGELLFANNQEHRLPLFCVKGVAYPGEVIHASEYRDSEDIHGKLEDVFNRGVSFISRNIRRIQRQKHVNSIGDLEEGTRQIKICLRRPGALFEKIAPVREASVKTFDYLFFIATFTLSGVMGSSKKRTPTAS